MPVFNYKGRNSNGELVTGSIELNSESAVASSLLSDGVTPIFIKPEVASKASKQIELNFSFKSDKIILDDLIVFCRQMYALTKSGIPIIRAINGLAESAKTESLKNVLLDLVEKLTGGIPLATAMKSHPKVFSDLFVSMIHIGENTGALDEAFLQLSEVLERDRDTIKRVKQATRYPMMVMLALTVALGVVNFMVIPSFASVFAKFGSDLPLPTLILQTSSNFLINYWWLVLGFLGATYYSLNQWKKTPSGAYKWDKQKLRWPILGNLLEKLALSRFTRNFGIMLKAGVSVTQSLSISADAVGNLYLAERINNMRSGIERGENLSLTAKRAEIFTPLVLQMIAVGEETGRVDELLFEVSSFYDEEADYALKRMSESIEPILIAAMGIIVLILALGVFLPIWDLSSIAK